MYACGQFISYKCMKYFKSCYSLALLCSCRSVCVGECVLVSVRGIDSQQWGVGAML